MQKNVQSDIIFEARQENAVLWKLIFQYHTELINSHDSNWVRIKGKLLQWRLSLVGVKHSEADSSSNSSKGL